jgi:hypothetical protein
MAMQNEFVPVAFCVLRTLEHCVTVTLLMFTQFCALTAAYHRHPQTAFCFAVTNYLFSRKSTGHSYPEFCINNVQTLCFDLTENTLCFITKTNRLTF